MVHELPQLAFEYADLEPFIDAKTMEIHHTKHHQAYITNLNTALKDYEKLSEMTVEQLLNGLDGIPETIRTIVRNNGGGHYSHSFFWKLLKKNGGQEPTGFLKEKIETTFGNFDKFKEDFTKAAMGRFGSGWAWLFIDRGHLAISSTPYQDSPLMEGKTPILGLDVWEHAYYLLYQNRRADYITAWWNVVNWDQVETNLKSA